MMEKYIRVCEAGKEQPKIFTAEEIADSVRGVGTWIWDGAKYHCSNCGAASREGKRFCQYCGAKKIG